MRDTYDPSRLHYWSETRPRGESRTTVIAPACSPSQTRTVSTSLVDSATDTTPGGVDQCEDCAAIVAALKGGA